MQHLQQSLSKSNAPANSIIHTHLAQTRHMINGLVDALKNVVHTNLNTNIVINSLNYAVNLLLTLAEIDHRPKPVIKWPKNVTYCPCIPHSLLPNHNTSYYSQSQLKHCATTYYIYLNFIFKRGLRYILALVQLGVNKQ